MRMRSPLGSVPEVALAITPILLDNIPGVGLCLDDANKLPRSPHQWPKMAHKWLKKKPMNEGPVRCLAIFGWGGLCQSGKCYKPDGLEPHWLGGGDCELSTLIAHSRALKQSERPQIVPREADGGGWRGLRPEVRSLLRHPHRCAPPQGTAPLRGRHNGGQSRTHLFFYGFVFTTRQAVVINSFALQ